ncbi:protein of unknown function [Kyrpidia spormannii]|uniref:Uncharacterized protein n=1 Tax=Kyrpidia spormannii TaxID=2055160 RepID=A0A6F9EGY6_9BACL|nr:protein of unknown function [Kyrpidia spormannii]
MPMRNGNFAVWIFTAVAVVRVRSVPMRNGNPNHQCANQNRRDKVRSVPMRNGNFRSPFGWRRSRRFVACL